MIMEDSQLVVMWVVCYMIGMAMLPYNPVCMCVYVSVFMAQ